APSAQAAIPSVFGGDLSCAAQPSAGNIRLCSGPTTTFDGVTKVDVNVILPPEPASGPDGPYPTIGAFHGWSGSKFGLTEATRYWANSGYAVFSQSDRGWGNSCGGSDPDRFAPKCAKGYNHLMDTRYEVRDAQYLLSVLADENVVQPTKIGAFGGSYGGGLSMALAALKDRVMNADGSYSPWQSPLGKNMAIAAATPEIPWTDLANALMPNGDTLDYVADAPYMKRNRIGVSKSSWVAGLFATGLAGSNYATPGTDMDADVISWYLAINAGEPYDGNPIVTDVANEVMAHHSSYYIDHSETPAPLLMSNGWTDDLFPADETIRFYNRTRSEHPSADLSLFYMDYGHMRGQNKDADIAKLRDRQNAWFDYYLKGVGQKPFEGVETLTQTCPKSAPSGGPYFAPSWAEIAPGEIRGETVAAQTIQPLTSDPTRGEAYDPVAGGGACATAPSSDQTGAANLRFDPAPASGYTLMGSPTIVADINSVSPTAEIAARLVDVPPGGGAATLVARGLYRPTVGSAANQVFQLHPNGYKFEAGHVAKLELLPNDVPYARPSNLQLPITISNLELRLPVLEQPGSGLVCQPAAKVLPAGYDLAPGFSAGGSTASCNAAESGAGGGGGSTPTGLPGAVKPAKKCAKAGKAKKRRKQPTCKRRHRRHKLHS
ncbi:MAG: type transport system ATP-binding protein, partial [Solirubrobacterales bacterium]|nr:type transport system ATP-binding protein [Solirubrobacterales bacterium]